MDGNFQCRGRGGYVNEWYCTLPTLWDLHVDWLLHGLYVCDRFYYYLISFRIRFEQGVPCCTHHDDRSHREQEEQKSFLYLHSS